MKLVACNAGITSIVQVQDKGIHEVEECILMHIMMAAVQPVYFIASYRFVVQHVCFVACAGRQHLPACVQPDKIVFQVTGKRIVQEMAGQANLIINKTIDEGIEDLLQ